MHTLEELTDQTRPGILILAFVWLALVQPAEANESATKSGGSSRMPKNVLLKGHLRSASTELTKFGIDCEKTGDNEWPLRVVDAKLNSRTGIREGDLLKEPVKSMEGTTVLVKRAERIYRSMLEKAPPEEAGARFSSLPIMVGGTSRRSEDDSTGTEILEDEIFKYKVLAERWRQWARPLLAAISRRCGHNTNLYSKGLNFRVNYAKRTIQIAYNGLPKPQAQLIYSDIAPMLLKRPEGSRLTEVTITIWFREGNKPVIPKPEDDSGHAWIGHINYDLPGRDPASRIGDTGIPYCVKGGKRLCYGGVPIADLPGELKVNTVRER